MQPPAMPPRRSNDCTSDVCVTEMCFASAMPRVNMRSVVRFVSQTDFTEPVQSIRMRTPSLDHAHAHVHDPDHDHDHDHGRGHGRGLASDLNLPRMLVPVPIKVQPIDHCVALRPRTLNLPRFLVPCFFHCFFFLESAYRVMRLSDCNDHRRTMVLLAVLVMTIFSSLAPTLSDGNECMPCMSSKNNRIPSP